MPKTPRPKRMVDRPTVAGTLGDGPAEVLGKDTSWVVGPRTWTTALCEWYEIGDQSVLKVPKDSDDNDLVDYEATVIKRLAGLEFGTHLFPDLLENLAVKSATDLKRGNVLRLGGQIGIDLYSLAQVHAAYPVLDPRDAAWMINRLLEALFFVHKADILHGAILPPHVFVNVRTHGLILGEWNYALVREGKKTGRFTTIDDAYEPWYPKEVLAKQQPGRGTDILMAARCAVQLMGGNPVTGELPGHVPDEIRGFLRLCLMESLKQRPNDAGALREEFGRILKDLYGERKFRVLAMPARA